MFSLFVIGCFYFFLPAYFTNMASSLSKKIGVLKMLGVPIDFGKKFKGRPILGDHKTWRGAISGIIVGMLMAFTQSYLYRISFIEEISFFDYGNSNIFLFGFLISSGAVFGDILFAFLKRRRNINPGDPWIPFDQINYVIGAFLFLALFMNSLFDKIISLDIWLVVLILTFFLHILANHSGYWLGLQKNRW